MPSEKKQSNQTSSPQSMTKCSSFLLIYLILFNTKRNGILFFLRPSAFHLCLWDWISVGKQLLDDPSIVINSGHHPPTHRPSSHHAQQKHSLQSSSSLTLIICPLWSLVQVLYSASIRISIIKDIIHSSIHHEALDSFALARQFQRFPGRSPGQERRCPPSRQWSWHEGGQSSRQVHVSHPRKALVGNQQEVRRCRWQYHSRTQLSIGPGDCLHGSFDCLYAFWYVWPCFGVVCLLVHCATSLDGVIG